MSAYFDSDLGHLAGFDTRPLFFPEKTETKTKTKTKTRSKTKAKNATKVVEETEGNEQQKLRDAYLKKRATENMDLMLKSLFALAKSQEKVSSCTLPTPSTRLPRYKPLPMKKPETRWEKYAKDKGIQNKKRDRMIWNEESQEWKPRYGYKSQKNQEQEAWVVELNDKDDPTEDKFLAGRRDKKLRTLKNKKKQLRNMEEASASTGKAASLPYGLSLGSDKEAARTKGMGGRSRKRAMKGKQGTKAALESAQVSTASLGRFDRKQENEPEIKRNKRQKKEDNLNFNNESMKKRDQRILKSVLKNA